MSTESCSLGSYGFQQTATTSSFPAQAANNTITMPYTQTDHQSSSIKIKKSPIIGQKCMKLNALPIDLASKLKLLINKEYLIEYTNWESIKIKQALNNKSESVEAELIDKETWIEECIDSLEDDQLPIIPIYVKQNHITKIEYVKIIKINMLNAYAAIGIQLYITKQFLYENTFFPSDIISLIMSFCPILKISSIYLDPKYIIDGQGISFRSQTCDNQVNMDEFKPFVSALKINESSDGIFIKFMEGESMSVPSEWDYDEMDDKFA